MKTVRLSSARAFPQLAEKLVLGTALLAALRGGAGGWGTGRLLARESITRGSQPGQSAPGSSPAPVVCHGISMQFRRQVQWLLRLGQLASSPRPKFRIWKTLERVVSVTSWFIHLVFQDVGLALLNVGD